DGKLGLRVTQPVMNYYGIEAGELARDGDVLHNKGLHLELRIEGDALVGHYPGPNSPMRLERVRRLPTAPEPPKVPTGPAPRWQTRIGSQVFASPVVHDATAYIATTGGVVNAVRVSDGAIQWAFGLGEPVHGS